MYPLNYHGRPLTSQKVAPANTVTSLSAYCYKYCLYKLNFDAGTADNAIVVGDWVVGAASGAVGKVVYLSAITGSWAANTAAGYVLIDSWNGTAWTDGEKIKVAADATMADVNQPAAIVEASDAEYNLAYRLPYKGKLAACAFVKVYDATSTHGVLIGIDGGIPDQTALIGIPMLSGDELWLEDYNSITNFQCVDYTASDASVVYVQFFF